jgi:hypothetical protein
MARLPDSLAIGLWITGATWLLALLAYDGRVDGMDTAVVRIWGSHRHCRVAYETERQIEEVRSAPGVAHDPSHRVESGDRLSI